MVNRINTNHSVVAIIMSTVLLSITVSLNYSLTLHTFKNPTIHEPYQIPANIQKHLTFGYNYAVSTLQWFYLINKFGTLNEKNKTDASFAELAKNLEIITRLNPKAEHAYYMSATILPWAMHSTKLSRPLLKRAIKQMPKQWQWPYYAGFNAYWFDHNMKDAARFMSHAAQLPDAPPIVASLAARMHAENNNLDTALTFLYHLLKNKQDKSLVKQLEKQIKQIETEKILRHIDRLLAHPPDWRKNGKPLSTLGIHLPTILPDGGHIIINAKGIPVSSVNKKRFKVFVPAHRQRYQQ